MRQNRSYFGGLLICAMVLIVCYCFQEFWATPESPSSSVPTAEESSPYRMEKTPNTAVHTGELILVNEQNPFVFPAVPTVVSASENLPDQGAFPLSYADTRMELAALTAAQQMYADFTGEKGKNALLLVSGYRDYAYQQDLYDQRVAALGKAQAERLVARPGKSEHHSGYAMDIGLKGGTFTGTGMYAWLKENAFRYGLVVRYTAEKEAITGVTDEPWHFRYVGRPHAAEMVARNLCLEEYSDFLQTFPFDGTHFFAADEGESYEIYYVSATDGEFTEIPVPRERAYRISGDNRKGFLVTVLPEAEP